MLPNSTFVHYHYCMFFMKTIIIIRLKKTVQQIFKLFSLRKTVGKSSNDRTSAAKKITDGMALIRTLMVLTTAFDRTKEKFYGFRQTVLLFLDHESDVLSSKYLSKAPNE